MKTNPTYKIRKATAADIAGMCVILKNDLGYSDCSEEIIKRQFSKLDESREAVFVAVRNDTNEDLNDNSVLGIIHVEKYNVIYYQEMANLLALAVSSECRRLGIGAALLKTAENWAKENGIKLMRLNSGSDRTGAHDFYRSQGYGSEKGQIRFIKEL